MVHTPKEFSDAGIKFVPSIITVYFLRSDEIVEPESIHQASSIPKTLSIHKFVRQINNRGNSSKEFFRTALDREVFFYFLFIHLFNVAKVRYTIPVYRKK